ncbi:hypothetical protein DERP_007788 [Dermatophagoides pteronyssinus]|uniref:D-3-phosphoglycerate dehydrogenase n=1 Tax=Dermatophagoides pteronyssinus TaxID=6956 RepID=A0ABQ8ISV4_DERPT|nr:hypothetical protein DERP_007788 [Dermatophagoides pteronyssinus]
MKIQIEKVLISDPIDPAAIQILRERNIHCEVATGLSPNELINIIKDYDALIVRSGTQVTKDVIDAGKNLKLIGRAGVGVDNIDCRAATRAGIIVINAPAGNTISAVELTCSMILSTARLVPQACQSLKSGKWDRKTFMGNEIKDKTLAIIGLGRIGREVAHRMQSFGMKTIGFDPLVSVEQAKEFGVESLSLNEIWPQADFITVHTPLIPQTKNMINTETLQKCKKGVRIINVARGGIIDENDLLMALKSGHCSGAGLDVYMEEPPKNRELIEHPLVVCTPHLGASTKEAQNNVAKEIALQFLDIMDGKSVAGVVNAPLLSEMLKHQNLLWTRLGRNLGMLAAMDSPSSSSLKLFINGNEARKVAKLIRETVLVGFLRIKTGKEVKLISASDLAADMNIDLKLEFPESSGHCCFSKICLKTDSGNEYMGIPQGRRSYLIEMNGHQFEPVISMESHLTFFQLKNSSDYELLIKSLSNQMMMMIKSITKSVDNLLIAIHSTESLQSLPKENQDYVKVIRLNFS